MEVLRWKVIYVYNESNLKKSNIYEHFYKNAEQPTDAQRIKNSFLKTVFIFSLYLWFVLYVSNIILI